MLSCWKPRRPSAALERALFPSATATLDRSQATPTSWLAWAAPALALARYELGLNPAFTVLAGRWLGGVPGTLRATRVAQ